MQKGFSEELKYKEAVNQTQKKLINIQNTKLDEVTKCNQDLERQLKLLQEELENERKVKHVFLNKLVQYESNKDCFSTNFSNNYY